MSRLWAMEGRKSGELLSLNGTVYVHPARAALEWMIRDTARIVGVPGTCPEEFEARTGRPAAWFKDHPDMAAVSWPLDKRRFRS